MFSRIETILEKKFIGQKLIMSFSTNETAELWRSFMPRRKEIQHTVGLELFSIEVYPPSFFDSFNPDIPFEKWAAVEVSDLGQIPDCMTHFVSPPGEYAIFIHKGPASEGPKTYQYIFKEWLPHSEYALDHRPHFAVMGDKYKHNQPDSEEELWIPVRCGRIA